ncbi:MAG: peptidoglycan DD-metalloendopeptidase family protein [Bacteroidales bacterium]|nr:peptidoglycan DD-metalloendopeptidase family protein [Bacteroidales bacterium]MDD4602886.1 peptidoglycan DD-metalloendopeptidase family protein [Bacteroidales bacterium]
MKSENHFICLFYKPGWLLFLVFLFVWQSGYSQSLKDKEKLQKTKHQLEEEIKYTTNLLEKTQKNKQSSLEKLQILTKQIRSREALINEINKELNEVEVKILVENLQIDKMSQQLQGMKSEYARLIYHAYRTMNGYNKLMFIFSAKDFNQAYLRIKYYQQYASFRRRQAEHIESTQLAINSQRKELENIKNQKLTLIQSQQEEKQKLDREKQQKTKSVKEYSSKEKQLLATLKNKQQAAQRLEYEIEKLIAEEIKASETRSHKATRTGAVGARTTFELTPREKELSSSFAANRGRLPWPCDRGFISGSFGEHAHPVLEHVKVKNNGIDIMTERGSMVKAVFGGRVSRVMSFPNLNKVVIIRHGDYLTVYSNLEEVSVRDGQVVSAKQNIGRVHTNADDQKTELHFELWRGKVIQNPEDWLAGR